MPGRSFNPANRYRYGFNGKENDPETIGTGEGTQDYGMRIYNPSLGRFLSVDPLTSEYAFYSPYHFAGNSPIAALDIDGLEPLSMVDKNGKLTKPVLTFLVVALDWDYGRMGLVKFERVNKKSYWMHTASTTHVYSNTDVESDYAGWLSCVGHEIVHINDFSDYPVISVIQLVDALWLPHDEQSNEIDAEKVEGEILHFMRTQNIEDILTNKNYSEAERIIKMRILGLEFKVESYSNRISSLNTKLTWHTKEYERLKQTYSDPNISGEYYNRYIEPVKMQKLDLQQKKDETQKEIDKTQSP